jgi:Zn-dependent protease with chaperone function
MTAAALLAVIAGALAWPVPRSLATARWTHRCPRAAIVLWQAVGLAGGVSAVLAALALGLAPLAPHLPAGVVDHAVDVTGGRPLHRLGPLNLLGLAVAAALATRLFTVLYLSTARTLRDRRRHRDLVDLTAHRHGPAWNSTDERGPDGCELCGHQAALKRLRILDHPLAVAYCLPGVRCTRVVVSAGLLETLTADELDAVLAHEHAHARGRHDLVIQPFVAWESTFPFLRPAREATAAVSLLIEMLADDVAARRAGGRTLARALARLGVTRAGVTVPAGALGITGGRSMAALTATAGLAMVRPASPDAYPSRSAVIHRIRRLLDPPAVPLWLPAVTWLAAVGVLMLPLVVVLTT